jgi:hypothetical protein
MKTKRRSIKRRTNRRSVKRRTRKKEKLNKYDVMWYTPSQLNKLSSDVLHKYAKMYNMKPPYNDKEIIKRFKYIKSHLKKGADIYNSCLFKDMNVPKKEYDKMKIECKKKQLQYYKKHLNKGEYSET